MFNKRGKYAALTEERMLNPAPAPFQDICIEPEWRKGIYMKAFQRKAWGPFNFQWRSISCLVPPKKALEKGFSPSHFTGFFTM